MADTSTLTVEFQGKDNGVVDTANRIKSSLAFGAAAKMGSAAVSMVGNAVKGLVGNTVNVGSSFSSAMSEVKAISGATGSDFQSLSNIAQEMGRTTQFSASQSADGLKYMAMAGWSAEQMVSGLPGVLSLAAASGEDLGKTSDIVTDSITAFGDSAADAGRYADVLASVSSNANTNVSMLGESFKYIAPVAGAMGYSMEDTAQALGIMANSGIKASAAGTSLRTMITNLAKPTDEVQGAMSQLGISLTDASGQMKPLNQVISEMRTSFAGLTEDQKAQYAATIAGKEGMSGLLALMNASEADVNKLSGAIENCDGAASKMADTMNDNLQGDLTKMSSAIEGVQLSLYQALEPALRSVVQFITGNVLPEIQKFAEWLGKLDFSSFTKKLQGLNINWGAVLGVVGAIAGIGTIKSAMGRLSSMNPFKGMARQANGTLSKLIKSVSSSFGTILKDTSKSISTLSQGFAKSFSTMSKGMASSFKILGSVPLTGVASGLLAIAGVVGIVTAAFLLLASCQGVVLPFLQGLSDIFVSLVGGVLDAFAQTLVTLSPILVTLAQAFAALAPLITAFGTAIATVITSIGEAAGIILTALTPIVGIIGQVFVQVVQIVSNAIVQIVQACAPFIPEITHMVEVVVSKLPEIIDAFSNLLSQVKPIIDSIGDAVKKFGSAIKDALDGVSGVIDSVGGLIKTFFDGLSGVIDSVGNAALNCGKGFEKLANGVKTLTNLNLLDMAASLAAVATGIRKIAGASSGLGDTGTQMQALGTGLMLIVASGTQASTTITMIATSLSQLSTAANIVAPLTMASAALASFATSAQATATSLISSGVLMATFGAYTAQVAMAVSMASSSIMMLTSVCSAVGSSAMSAAGGLMALTSAALNSGTAFTAMQAMAIAAMAGMTAGIVSGMARSVSAMQSGTRQMVSTLRASVAPATSAGQMIGTGASNGLRTGASRMASYARAAVQSAINSMSGYYGRAYSAGYNIGAGLANGMNAAQGRVRAAANALASSADEAIRKAQEVHSPSRLQFKNGQYIGEGLAKGIASMASRVQNAMVNLSPELAFADSRAMTIALDRTSDKAADEYKSPEYTFHFHLEADGKEFAKVSAKYTQEEIRKIDKINKLLKGER